MNAKFLGSQETEAPMTVTLFRVYCYHGVGTERHKQVWWECECTITNEGVSWSPLRATAVSKAEKRGYTVTNKDKPVIRFYRSEN